MRPDGRFSLGFRAARVAVLGILLAGCAWLGWPFPEAPVSPPPAAPPPAASAVTPPEWRPGDQWIYEWTSGSSSGTKTVQVAEVRQVRTVPFYVVRIGELEHFYTQDLQWAGTVRDGKVESRMTPAQPWFVWPLEAGRRWTHRGTFEERSGSSPVSDSFAVVGTDSVEVPAGRYSALKVVREAGRGDSDEYWYVPEIRFYARWVGQRGPTRFEEKLREYRAAPRLIPDLPAPPSRTQ